MVDLKEKVCLGALTMPLHVNYLFAQYEIVVGEKLNLRAWCILALGFLKRHREWKE